MLVTLYQCPHKVMSVAMQREDGSGFDRRITPDKCCGSWQRSKQWKMSPRDSRILAKELLAELKPKRNARKVGA